MPPTKARAVIFAGLGLLALAFLVARPPLPVPLQPHTANATTRTSPARFAPDETARTAGVDISHYQGTVTWAKIDPAQVHFIFAKASEGITGVDKTYAAHATAARDRNIPFGAYHFFVSPDDGQKQAKHFLATAKPQKGDLPPVVDVETLSKSISSDTLRTQVDAWLSYVHAQTQCIPIVYASPAFYEAHLSGLQSPHHFWLADYATKARLPKSVEAWLFWQHSQDGTVNGVNAKVDLNWFAGAAEDLEAITCK